jgi:hypothetical protein
MDLPDAATTLILHGNSTLLKPNPAEPEPIVKNATQRRKEPEGSQKPSAKLCEPCVFALKNCCVNMIEFEK